MEKDNNQTQMPLRFVDETVFQTKLYISSQKGVSIFHNKTLCHYKNWLQDRRITKSVTKQEELNEDKN